MPDYPNCKALERVRELLTSRDKVREGVVRILRDCLESPDLSPMDSDRITTDLNADDLACVEILLAVEEDFLVELAEEDTPDDITVGGLVEAIRRRSEK